MSNQHNFIPQDLDQAFKRQTWYTSIAYTTYFLFGIMRGYPTFLLDQLRSEDSIIPVKSTSEISWIASLSIFPNPFGSILAGLLMDKYGRRITMQLSMLVFTVGWTFITCSHSLMMLYLGNIIVGVAIGMGACSTIYVAEICEVRNRCMLLSMLEVYFSMGILVAYVSTCYLKWNVAALIFTIFSAISLFLLYWIPETPYWLLKKNRMEEAILNFSRLRNDTKKEDNDHEFKMILVSLEEEAEEVTWGVRAIRDNLKPLLILILFHVLLQGSGYTILLSYLANFLKGFRVSLDIKSVAIGYSISSFVASFLTPLSVNYWQRKEITVLSGIGMTLTLITLALFDLYSKYRSSVEALWYIVPICLYLYMISCTIGVLTLSQAMIGELYPTEVRGIMCGLTEAIGTILSGISVKVYPIVEEHADENEILFFFAVFGIATIFYGKFILPETYGKSLSEIQCEYFTKKKKTGQKNVKKLANIERTV